MGWEKGGGRSGPVGSRARGGPTGHPQVVRTRGWQWSDEAELIFFDTLAASANVCLAADAAGFSTPTVYRQRQMRPDFAEKWARALVQGYARVEMALVRSAADSMDGVSFGEDQPIPMMTVDQAMSVLKAHRSEVEGRGRGRPGAKARPRTLAEVRASILAKIAAVERLPEPGAETKDDRGPQSGADGAV